MKKTLFVLGILIAMVLVSGPTWAQFRCGPSLVSLGASKAEVLMKCKKPMMVEQVGASVVGSQSGRTNYLGRGQYSTESTYAESQAAVEQWFYNTGDGQFLTILTFVGGSLQGIRPTDQRCTGPADWEK